MPISLRLYLITAKELLYYKYLVKNMINTTVQCTSSICYATYLTRLKQGQNWMPYETQNLEKKDMYVTDCFFDFLYTMFRCWCMPKMIDISQVYFRFLAIKICVDKPTNLGIIKYSTTLFSITTLPNALITDTFIPSTWIFPEKKHLQF